jgi:hypothetical protein
MNTELTKRSTYLSKGQMLKLTGLCPIFPLSEYERIPMPECFSIIRFMTVHNELFYGVVDTRNLEKVTGATQLKEKSQHV